jgi:hypothetical protein
MSVAAPVVETWDGENRRVYLKQGITTFHWIDDIYSEYRQQRRVVEVFRKWAPLMVAAGNAPKGGGKYTPRYLILLGGTRVIPYDEHITLVAKGEAITDNPEEDPDPFDTSTRYNPLKVYLEPSSAEVIRVDGIGGGGGGLTQEQAQDAALAALVDYSVPTAEAVGLQAAQALSDLNLGSLLKAPLVPVEISEQSLWGQLLKSVDAISLSPASSSTSFSGAVKKCGKTLVLTFDLESELGGLVITPVGSSVSILTSSTKVVTRKMLVKVVYLPRQVQVIICGGLPIESPYTLTLQAKIQGGGLLLRTTTINVTT